MFSELFCNIVYILYTEMNILKNFYISDDKLYTKVTFMFFNIKMYVTYIFV